MDFKGEGVFLVLLEREVKSDLISKSISISDSFEGVGDTSDDDLFILIRATAISALYYGSMSLISTVLL